MNNKNKALSLELTPLEREKLIAAVTFDKEGRSPQRLIKKLVAVYPATLATLDVNQQCAISNISDIACKANKRIHKHGFFIACQKPITPFKNRFGHPSQMHLWALHRLPEAANDSNYSLTEGE